MLMFHSQIHHVWKSWNVVPGYRSGQPFEGDADPLFAQPSGNPLNRCVASTCVTVLREINPPKMRQPSQVAAGTNLPNVLIEFLPLSFAARPRINMAAGAPLEIIVRELGDR